MSSMNIDNEEMNKYNANTKMLSKVMLRLLPLQVLLAAVGAVNGIVSSLFATNFVGESAMSAVTLYFPINILISSVGAMMIGGASILCGKYLGRNEQDKLQIVFTVDLLVSFVLAIVFMIILIAMGIFGAPSFFTDDEAVKPLFNSYLIGQAVGIIPFLLGNQFSAFLSLENKARRTIVASIVYIIVNIILNFVLVKVLSLQALGLALASSLGMWIFMMIQAHYFIWKDTAFKFKLKCLNMKMAGSIIKVGAPGALTNGYQTIRGLAVNKLITMYVGSVGLSALGACNNMLAIFWAIPAGMQAVTRMIISISLGEEDRETLKDVLKVTLSKYIPIMCAVCAVLIALSNIMAGFFYHDHTSQAYQLTVWGFRLLPICMPLAVLALFFECYAQTYGKQILIHLMSLCDGVVFVTLFTALLIRSTGMNGVYLANVINGFAVILIFVIYSIIKNKGLTKSLEKFLVIPKDFGVSRDHRLDLSVLNMDDVISVSEKIMNFCMDQGIDRRRSYIAGLSMEEMAGNVVEHGFGLDKKKHSIDIRVVNKGGKLFLRIKDDCMTFDPKDKMGKMEDDGSFKNIGIKMIINMAEEVDYQSILGMNVLTINV